jgi:hypothetical protein
MITPQLDLLIRVVIAYGIAPDELVDPHPRSCAPMRKQRVEPRNDGGSAWESNPPCRCSRRASSVLKLIADDHPQVYLGVRSCPFSSRNLYLDACSSQTLSLAWVLRGS